MWFVVLGRCVEGDEEKSLRIVLSGVSHTHTHTSLAMMAPFCPILSMPPLAVSVKGRRLALAV